MAGMFAGSHNLADDFTNKHASTKMYGVYDAHDCRFARNFLLRKPRHRGFLSSAPIDPFTDPSAYTVDGDQSFALVSTISVQRLNDQHLLTFEPVALDCTNHGTENTTKLHRPTSVEFNAIYDAYDGCINWTILTAASHACRAARNQNDPFLEARAHRIDGDKVSVFIFA
jgi:hypothetical protein